MPRRHAQKNYVENSYYHIFNRGVDKSAIFRDDFDYTYFSRLLNFYLTPYQNEAQGIFSYRMWRTSENDLSRVTQLVAYCLMPNHYHLIIRQVTADGLTRLMKRVIASYSRYYNNRYSRTGHLFEGSCQARNIIDDSDLISTSAYVHRNPKDITNDIINYRYSNLKDIANKHTSTWTNTKLLLNYFDYDEQAYVDYVCENLIPQLPALMV
jgi:putative transposase